MGVTSQLASPSLEVLCDLSSLQISVKKVEKAFESRGREQVQRMRDGWVFAARCWNPNLYRLLLDNIPVLPASNSYSVLDVKVQEVVYVQ